MGAFVPIVLALASFTNERVTEIDTRPTEEEGWHYIVFCARYERPGSLRGDAYVLLGQGENRDALIFERRYGLHMIPGRQALGEMSEEQVAASRSGSAAEAPRPEAFYVRIDSNQYARCIELVDEWRAKDSFDYPLPIELAHLSEQLFKVVEVYPSYRAAFRGFNAIEYYVDLRKLNENRGRQAEGL